MIRFVTASKELLKFQLRRQKYYDASLYLSMSTSTYLLVALVELLNQLVALRCVQMRAQISMHFRSIPQAET